jgi:hypothetical protein
MYIQRLSISDSPVANNPNLQVALINPNAPDFFPETTLELFFINQVEYDEEQVGSVESPRTESTFTFIHQENQGARSIKSFMSITVTEMSPLGSILMGSPNCDTSIAFLINAGSNVVQNILEIFNMIKQGLGPQPIQTPPIQPEELNGGKN